MEMDLLIGVIALAYLSSFVSPDAQGDALYALRTSLNASSNQLTDWNTDQVFPCTWSKITCDRYCLIWDFPNLVPKNRDFEDADDTPACLNSLSGKIPEQLFRFPSIILREPVELWHQTFPPCASENAGRTSKSKTGMIVGIALATDSFSEKKVLGQGGFGKVYKGVLADNTKVAVKRLTDFESPGGDIAFQREVEMISVAVHRNLLRLIGFCTTPTERLLVYPFMQNLSVASRLRELKPGEPVLDWPTRKRVALGTARGLEYLHEHCNPKIIHRGVKAANVLLDGDLKLSLVILAWQKKTDVFGYGIMLLELVTGQRAIDFSRLEDEDDVLLLDHVKKLQREKKLGAIVDRNLHKTYDIHEVEMVIQVATLHSVIARRPSSNVRGCPDAGGRRASGEVGIVGARRDHEEVRVREVTKQVRLGRTFGSQSGRR
ncbi:hypothetical protein DH2020_047805 [Rehmannia glutinosa]|uniref:non-specific serine/threonine protein kinase n=1 Tax=Rehmannia glutinosa TaxID=99300 RepID=A0ABR0U791_REHGL